MDANVRSLDMLFGYDERFEVPLYQRAYVWNESDHWAPLWSDIMGVAERRDREGDNISSHFLGAVVLSAFRRSTGTMPGREVIDGQQRLTTLQVMLSAFRDASEFLGAPPKITRLFNRLVSNNEDLASESDEIFKVWPTNQDQMIFRRVMRGDRPGAPILLEKQHVEPPLVAAYRYFRKMATDWSTERGLDTVSDSFDLLLRVVTTGLQLVVIDLEDADDAQVIFESLNDRGAGLQPSDLIKNHVLKAAKRRGESVELLYMKYWSPFEAEIWKQEQSQGRRVRTRLDIFLTQFLTMETGQEVPITQVFSAFRNWLGQTHNDLAAPMGRLARHGVLFQNISQAQPSGVEGRFFASLPVLDQGTVVPVLLWLLDNVADPVDRMEAMLALDSFLVRRLVCRLTPKNYNRLFLDLINRLKSTGDASQVSAFLCEQSADSTFWPGDVEVRRALMRLPIYKLLNQRRLRLILLQLNFQSETAKSESVVLDQNLTIEHLLPQSWQAHWPVSGDSDVAEARDLALHTLGNLTLISGKLNPALSNGPWADKKRELHIHSRLALNSRLPDTWNVDAIVARSSMLTGLFLQRWPRPGHKMRTPLPPDFDRDKLLRGDIVADQETRIDAPSKLDSPRNWSESRRPHGSVAKHIVGVFSSYPVGAILSVAEIVARGSMLYRPGEVSSGAVAQCLRGSGAPGVRLEPGPPLSARKVSAV